MSTTHMIASKTSSAASKTQPDSNPLKVLTNALQRAIKKAKRGLGVAQEIDEASMLLESLPLTTEEFGLAGIRLRNANRYVVSGEFGAASWELCTLRKLLSRQD